MYLMFVMDLLRFLKFTLLAKQRQLFKSVITNLILFIGVYLSHHQMILKIYLHISYTEVSLTSAVSMLCQSRDGHVFIQL